MSVCSALFNGSRLQVALVQAGLPYSGVGFGQYPASDPAQPGKTGRGAPPPAVGGMERERIRTGLRDAGQRRRTFRRGQCRQQGCNQSGLVGPELQIDLTGMGHHLGGQGHHPPAEGGRPAGVPLGRQGMTQQYKQVIRRDAQVEVQGIGVKLPAGQAFPGKVALEFFDAILRVLAAPVVPVHDLTVGQRIPVGGQRPVDVTPVRHRGLVVRRVLA